MYGTYISLVTRDGEQLTGRNVLIRVIKFKTRPKSLKLKIFAHFDTPKHIRFRDTYDYDKTIKLNFETKENIEFVSKVFELLKGNIITHELYEFIKEEYPEITLDENIIVFNGTIHMNIDESNNTIIIDFVKGDTICYRITITKEDISHDIFCDDEDVVKVYRFISSLS